MTTNIENYPVMKKMCSTCPFHLKHEGQVEIAIMVMERCITTASQICHHPRLSGKAETHICRGAREYQKKIFHRLGVISAPTDEAWDKAVRKIKEV